MLKLEKLYVIVYAATSHCTALSADSMYLPIQVSIIKASMKSLRDLSVVPRHFILLTYFIISFRLCTLILECQSWVFLLRCPRLIPPLPFPSPPLSSSLKVYSISVGEKNDKKQQKRKLTISSTLCSMPLIQVWISHFSFKCSDFFFGGGD